MSKMTTELGIAGANQQRCCGAIAVLVAGLALVSCTAMPSAAPSSPSAQDQPNAKEASAADVVGQRELTPEEKKVIVAAVAPSLRDPAAAKYRWAKIRKIADGSVDYCAMVNAKSPYPAYDGQQAYIVEAKVVGGKVSSAVIGLIAGGKDIEIVRKMCKKYDLDPDNAT